MFEGALLGGLPGGFGRWVLSVVGLWRGGFFCPCVRVVIPSRTCRWASRSLVFFATVIGWPVSRSRPLTYIAVERVPGVGVKSWNWRTCNPRSLRVVAILRIESTVQPGWEAIR